MSIGGRQVVNGWCILRTSAGRTLGLASSLGEAGIEAWSPSLVQSRRRPRSTERRDVTMPIMPTFVFVRAAHLDELRRILALPISPHPPFSIFRYLGGTPTIADSEIRGLRIAEERAALPALRKERRSFAKGAQVSVPEGGFAGLSGIVEESDGKFALVAFGNFRVKIAAFLLRTDEVQEAPAQHGPAALAA